MAATEAFFYGLHALAMMVLENLRLRLCSDQMATMPTPDAEYDGDNRNEYTNNSRIHLISPDKPFGTPLIPASGHSGCKWPVAGRGATRYTRAQYQGSAASHKYEYPGRPGASSDCRHGARRRPARRPEGGRPPGRARGPHAPLPPEGHAPGGVHRARSRAGRRPVADGFRQGLAGAGASSTGGPRCPPGCTPSRATPASRPWSASAASCRSRTSPTWRTMTAIRCCSGPALPASKPPARRPRNMTWRNCWSGCRNPTGASWSFFIWKIVVVKKSASFCPCPRVQSKPCCIGAASGSRRWPASSGDRIMNPRQRP